MLKTDKGFTLFETLIASLLLFSMLTMLLPLLSLLAKEQYNSMERLQITSQLQDELQGVLNKDTAYPSKYKMTPYRISAEFSFTLDGEYLKGCAEWTNAKEKREKKCLYAIME